MSNRMEKYLKALSGNHSMVPANQVRENIRSMRQLDESFNKDLKSMFVALGRKDIDLIEKAIEKMESTIAEAKDFVKKVKGEDDNKDEKDSDKEKEKEGDEE